MFIISAVEAARRQQHAGGVSRRRFWGDGNHHRAQIVRIRIDRLDGQGVEQIGAEPQHRLPVFHHVGYARRCPRIVFQNVELIWAGAYQINAANVGIKAMRRREAVHRDAELAVCQHQLLGDDAVLQDRAFAIDIGDKGVERMDALFKSSGEPAPFLTGEQAGDDIERNDALRRFIVTVNGKGDAQLAEGGFCGTLAAA